MLKAIVLLACQLVGVEWSCARGPEGHIVSLFNEVEIIHLFSKNIFCGLVPGFSKKNIFLDIGMFVTFKFS